MVDKEQCERRECEELEGQLALPGDLAVGDGGDGYVRQEHEKRGILAP